MRQLRPRSVARARVPSRLVPFDVDIEPIAQDVYSSPQFESDRGNLGPKVTFESIDSGRQRRSQIVEPDAKIVVSSAQAVDDRVKKPDQGSAEGSEDSDHGPGRRFHDRKASTG